MRRTVAIATRLRDADVPDDLVDALSRAFDEYQRGS
jgi:hypothetical protein